MTKKAVEKTTEKATEKPELYFGLLLVLIGLGGLAVGLTWDAIPAVGATLLGFVVGMLVGFFAQEAKEWNRSAVTAAVSVLTAAGALVLLRFGAPDSHGVWFYPVGLVVGFGFGTIWIAFDSEESEEADQAAR